MELPISLQKKYSDNNNVNNEDNDNPTLLNVAHIIYKHSYVLYSSEHCKNVFTNIPIVAFHRSNDLSGILVTAQLPETVNCNNARATPGFLRYNSRNSLRADEIKLWLTPSAKERRNPCSGLPAVYPDLSTRHDWPVKKGFVLFVVIANQIEGEFETHFR